MRRKTNPAVEAREVRAFDLAVSGFTNSQIAQLLGVERHTIERDLSAEGARRAAERSSDRASLIQRNVAHYEKICSDSALRVSQLLAAASAETDPHAAAALRGIVPREVLCQIKSREQVAKTLGLLAPLDVSVSVSNEEVEGLRREIAALQNEKRFNAAMAARNAFLSGETDVIPHDAL